MKKAKECPHCEGQGVEPCYSKGTHYCEDRTFFCSCRNGTGWTKSPCSKCKGTGVVKK